MPSIELDGHSEARFELRDGKIVRVEGTKSMRNEAIQRPPDMGGPSGPKQ